MALTKVIGAGLGSVSSADLDGAVTINESSADKDFRVESNGQANMLFVDGGNNAVVVGQSAPDTTISGGTPAFQVIGSGFESFASLTRRVANSSGPVLLLAKSRNTAVGSHTVVQNGDVAGEIVFIADDGTDFDSRTASIKSEVDSAPGANDTPGRLVFMTTADGANSPTERMRIHNGGVVSIPQGIALGVGTANTASNVLNDYEEGTFTPAFVNVNAPTYSSQVGRYTKIGNAVHCTVSIDVSTGLDTSDGSTVSIGGLPFTAVSSELATNGFLGRYINLLGSKATSLSNIRQTDSAIMLLQGHDSGIQYNQINSGGFLQIAFTYRSA